MERKNKNRGFRKLIVWQDAIELYVIANEVLSVCNYKYTKSVANTLDACQSVSRNIAEGYCRKGIKEYLQFLNFAIASAGEFHSEIYSFYKAKLIREIDFEKMDRLLFKIENQMIRLIEKLKQNRDSGNWEDSYL